MKILKIELANQQEILVNQNQICWVAKHNDKDGVLLYMSNGEVLDVLSPTWEEWEGDLYNG